MAETDPHDAFIHGTEDEQMASYYAVYPPAIVALVLGLLSPLALVSPWMWPLPLVAIALAISSLLRINEPNSNLVGGWAAVVGMTLAVCFGTWAPTQYFARAAILSRQAETAADRWFASLRAGDAMEAHQWMLGASERAPRGETLESFYVDVEEAGKQLADFKTKEFVIRLQEDPALKMTFLGRKRMRQDNFDYVILRYELAGRTAEEPPLLIELQLNRFALKHPGRVIWQVSRAEVVDE